MNSLRTAALLVLSGLTLSATAATSNRTHEGSRTQQERASRWNQSGFSKLFSNGTADWNVEKPFSEAETTGYVAISSADDFELPDLRDAIAKNLPQGVTLVIYVSEASEVSALKQKYSPYLAGARLKFLLAPLAESSSNPIWGRDSLPYAVHMKSDASGNLVYGLVDSIYPQEFEPDAEFAKSFGMPMINTREYFRNGNMLLDADGNCFSEHASEVADLSDPEYFFTHFFGCKSFTMLNREGGIGDIDERVKFLPNNNVMTDNDNYEKIFISKGYVVHKVPKTGHNYETYMNSLLVNGTVFVPQMGKSTDSAALDAYRAVGLNPVGVITRQLADQGHGNIHCTTMNYPEGTFTASPMGADFIQFRAR